MRSLWGLSGLSGLFLLPAVVVDFDSEDDDGADGSDYVCDYNGPVAEHDALDDEEDGSESEHAECGECDAVGVACPDCGDGLGEVSEDHAESCGVADDFECHGVGVCFGMVSGKKSPARARRAEAGDRLMCVSSVIESAGGRVSYNSKSKEGVAAGLLFECADANSVPGLFLEHVADAFAFSGDAVSLDLVLVDEGVLDCLGTVLGELHVEVVVAVLGSVTLDDNLAVGVALHVVGNHRYVGHLVGGDGVRADAEEYEADGVVLVGNFLDNLDFGLLVLASLEFGGEFAGLSLPGAGGSYASVELAAEVVDQERVLN